jgi:single-strand DNA-binding protein
MTSMANLNKVHLIGRLTKDPECRTFTNGGKVAQIRFAVNNRKKNQQTGAWEDVPVWLDVKAFNRETGRKLADTCEQYLRKGNQCYIEGHLVLEEWEDKNGGGKRSKLVVVMDDLQFLEPRAEGAGGGMRSSNYAPTRQPAPTPDHGDSEGGSEAPDFNPGGPAEGDIPF